MNSDDEQFVIPKADSWQMFDKIAKRYDFLNRILSFGLDTSWRRQLVKHLPMKPGQLVLDLATGTANVLITILQNNPHVRLAYGIDLSMEMLKIGQAKINQKGLSSRAMLQKGNALALTFMDDTFEVVTIAFGIRNLPSLMKALMEMYRVLKPQGRVLILEFSLPRNSIVRLGHCFYLRGIVPCLGFLFSGNYRAYRYLNQTIETFPYGERFCKIIAQVGFKNVTAHSLTGGVATIYEAEK